MKGMEIAVEGDDGGVVVEGLSSRGIVVEGDGQVPGGQGWQVRLL